MGSAINSRPERSKKTSNANAVRIEDLVKKGQTLIKDEEIERYEFHDYEPVARTNLSREEEIRINIEQQDLFTLPSETFLLFEGRLLKADKTAYANGDAVSLTSNGIMHLFSQILYQLSNQEVESVYHPDQATTMLGMLKYPNDFQLAQGLNQLWTKGSAITAVFADNAGFAIRQAYIVQKSTTKGTFSFSIPLKHIFRFCDDYNKVIYGFKHTPTLVKKSDDDATFRIATVAAGQVNLDKISLFIPHVNPSDIEKNNLYKAIESKITLSSVKTSTEKPRYIIVGFQTIKDGNQELSPSIFDHCDLKNMYIMLNQEKYPAVDNNLLFPNQQFSRAYRDASTFSEKFYGMNELITQSNITPADNKDLYPLMVFDVSKQSERLKSSVVDVQIKAAFNAAVPAELKLKSRFKKERLLDLRYEEDKIEIRLNQLEELISFFDDVKFEESIDDEVELNSFFDDVMFEESIDDEVELNSLNSERLILKNSMKNKLVLKKKNIKARKLSDDACIAKLC
ncbi:uncharacterized protein LOC136072409 [Hydra vulgaris]|uniref:uncharacterized protein LOC136072409 n=1 Tax=Hydra vulgaris TaxID=6087 RepID=UPI0032E9EE39